MTLLQLIENFLTPFGTLEQCAHLVIVLVGITLIFRGRKK